MISFPDEFVPFGSRVYSLIAIGLGIIGYALAVAFYTLLSVWRLRRAMG